MSLARLQIPYLTTAQRTAIVPNDRDLVYDTDLKKIYVGDGTTAGGAELGVKGDPGVGIVWLGAYDAGHPYVAYDAVSYLSSSYICILASTGNLPTNATYWNVLVLASGYYPGGPDVAIADGGTGASTAQVAIDALTAVAGATNEHILTKDTATGNAKFKAPPVSTVFASAAEINAGTEPAKAIAPDQLKAANIRLPMGHLYGLTVSHAADAEHDITVAAGKARGDADTYDITLASAMTKRIDAAWEAGTDKGGLAAGEAIPASGTLHYWLIYGASGVDLMFNNHATTALNPTLPAGYNLGKRRIWSFRTDASSNIINGDQWGTGLIRTWMYDTPIRDLAAAPGDTAAKTLAISTPGGIVVQAIYNLASTGGGGATASFYVSALANADMAASVTAAPLGSMSDLNATVTFGPKLVFTDTSSRIRYRVTINVTMYLSTLGWEDSI